MSFRVVKGMNDLLPADAVRWRRVEAEFRRTVELCGYGELRTPMLEHTELFVRSIGDTTDVVEKEMFTFQRSHESLTLRPEGTAGAARAYLTNKVAQKEPVSRWYYLGPMFRAEQPQRGRYRQFHQAGCELYGCPGPVSDAEMIDMLWRFLTAVGIPDVQICLNSIGGPESRERYRQELLAFLQPKRSQLSEHAQRRLEANPLRVLDSKDPRDQEAAEGAPVLTDVLTPEDRTHWERLLSALTAMGTPYTIDHRLVRGLDYYTRTLFELKSQSGDLGTQNTLAGGGRYDGMIRSLGGPEVPAIGFALGLERVLLALPEGSDLPGPQVYVAPMGAQAQEMGLLLSRELRGHEFRVELDARGNSLKSMLRRADAMKAPLCLVLGDSELAQGQVQVKDLERHEQKLVPLAELATFCRERLASATGSQG